MSRNWHHDVLYPDGCGGQPSSTRLLEPMRRRWSWYPWIFSFPFPTSFANHFYWSQRKPGDSAPLNETGAPGHFIRFSCTMFCHESIHLPGIEWMTNEYQLNDQSFMSTSPFIFPLPNTWLYSPSWIPFSYRPHYSPSAFARRGTAETRVCSWGCLSGWSNVHGAGTRTLDN